MKRKIIIILAIIGIALLIASPVVAKEKVKVKITTEDYALKNKGYIVIKLETSDGFIFFSRIASININDVNIPSPVGL